MLRVSEGQRQSQSAWLFTEAMGTPGAPGLHRETLTEQFAAHEQSWQKDAEAENDGWTVKEAHPMFEPETESIY